MQKPTEPSQFTPIRSVRLSEAIIRQIAKLVEEGTLRVDDRFPTERALQERWQVSRPILREAFRMLEMQGLVESRPGNGRFLRSDHIPETLHSRAGGLMNREHLIQIWEAREAVEIKAAEIAVERGTKEQLRSIAVALKTLDAASPSDRRRFGLNREFHISVARASGNPVLEDILSDLLDRSSRAAFKDSVHDEDWRTRKGRHRAIYDALIARDGAAVRRAMKLHFQLMRDPISN